MPICFAIAAAVQCVASPGGSPPVSATTYSITVVGSGGLPEGRVLSRRRPSTPSSMKRSCQRQTHVLSFPLCRSMPLVPTPRPRVGCARLFSEERGAEKLYRGRRYDGDHGSAFDCAGLAEPSCFTR